MVHHVSELYKSLSLLIAYLVYIFIGAEVVIRFIIHTDLIQIIPNGWPELLLFVYLFDPVIQLLFFENLEISRLDLVSEGSWIPILFISVGNGKQN